MRPSKSSYYAQIFVAVVLLGVLEVNSVSERGDAAPADEHAVLVDNIGTYGRKISTKSPLAQEFFDQGLRLVYGYYFPEAIGSFEEAQQYDPDHPMLDWGLALAMGPNPNSRKNGVVVGVSIVKMGGVGVTQEVGVVFRQPHHPLGSRRC